MDFSSLPFRTRPPVSPFVVNSSTPGLTSTRNPFAPPPPPPCPKRKIYHFTVCNCIYLGPAVCACSPEHKHGLSRSPSSNLTNPDPSSPTAVSTSTSPSSSTVTYNITHFTLRRLRSECPECIQFTQHLGVEYSAQMYIKAERDVALWGELEGEDVGMDDLARAMEDVTMENVDQMVAKGKGPTRERPEETVERLFMEVKKAERDQERIVRGAFSSAPVDMRTLTKLGQL